MLTYSFVEKGSDSLYEHLYKCLKNDIVRGILVPGERLPSKRSFAKNHYEIGRASCRERV